MTPLYDNEDSVCGIIYNGSAYYFYKNLQGDIIEIANRVGTVVARYSYDAWGKVTAITDGTGVDISNNVGHVANANPFRYRGYYYDAEIGMYYLQSRYYDPVVGRFINADHDIFITSGRKKKPINLYTYCDNCPIHKIDFEGFLAITATAISIATIMEAIKAILVGVLVILVMAIVIGILTDENVQGCIKDAVSNVQDAVKAKIEAVAVAIVIAYALAQRANQNSKYEVHHIVAQNAMRAVFARIILALVGIGIQSSINKVAIKYNLHRRLHSYVYYDAVNAAVIAAYYAGSTSSDKKAQVAGTLLGIRLILLSLSSYTP